MPEIAEVRTVSKQLNNKLGHAIIKDIQVIYAKTIEENVENFKQHIINSNLIEVTNYGKYLFFNFGEYTMVSHLRMEGKYFYKSDTEPIVKHEHVIFYLDNGYTLRYYDTRKFGRMITIKTIEINDYIKNKNLGHEPNSKLLTKEYLFNKIKDKNTAIKNLLLDQSIICGLGNIYVDEVLFASKINPNKAGKYISKIQCEEIIKNSKEITELAYKYGGTTIHTFNSLGKDGEYQNYLKVHTKDICPNCGSKISKIKIGGRGTYLCAKCQK